MKLLVCAHEMVAYFISDDLFEQIEISDKEYESTGSRRSYELIEEIKKDHFPIEIGYILTGDL